MESTETSTAAVHNNNNNYSNNNNNNNTKMTSAENTSYEDDFEKDTSSDNASQQQQQHHDNSILNDSSNNNTNSDSNSNNASVRKSDDSYEDDFEKDLSMDDTSTKNVSSSPRKSSDDDDIQTSLTEDLRPPLTVAVTTSPRDSTNSPTLQTSHSESEGSVRDTQQRDKPPALDADRHISGPQSQTGPQQDGGASDNESELDADAYNFTEDQRRAMLELMVQKQEDVDLLDEEPPEYNVKGRLEQLNAELANDPAPVEGERETRVGFKAEIVDLVAPPQEFSDDDASQPNSAREDPKPSPFAATPSATSETNSKSENSSTSPPPKPSPFAASTTQNDTESEDGRGGAEEGKAEDDDNETKRLADDPNKKQFVVERDGQFSVLSANELTPSERAMLMEERSEPAGKKQTSHSSNHSQSKDARSSGDNKSNSAAVVPRPPTQPRPNTAATSNGAGRRSFVKQTGQQSPRPKSADHQQQHGGKRGTSSSSSSHSSGLSDDFNYRSPYARSEELREMSREQSRKQEEERREKEKRRKEEEQQRREDNDSAFQTWLRKKREENQPRADGNPSDTKKSEDERVKENEDAYKTWLKEKRAQGKKEKLLHRRQQQEKMEGYFMRPREECEQAFKEWLKKKNADLRRQQSLERQKSKMYRVQVKRSRKTQALVRALKESQAFRYVDYYGYRY